MEWPYLRKYADLIAVMRFGWSRDGAQFMNWQCTQGTSELQSTSVNGADSAEDAR